MASTPAALILHALAAVDARAARALGIPRTLASARAAGAVALTFDDGPHPEGTPAILEILATHRARATFFVVGEQVARRPQLVRRILEEGHGVALHGHRHALQTRRGARALQQDYVRGIAAIEDAAGITPTHHRPPYGVYSPAGLTLARERELQPLLWAAWGKDWRKFTTPARIAGRVLRRLSPGDAVLLHDADFYSARGSHERTAAALELVLAQLKLMEIGTVSIV